MTAITNILAKVESAVANVTLNDASDAHSDLQTVQDTANAFCWVEKPEQCEDEISALHDAIEEAIMWVDEMIGNGWADDGYEVLVMRKMEDQIMPAVEEAIEDLRAVLRIEALRMKVRKALRAAL